MKNGPQRGWTTPTRGTVRIMKATPSPTKSYASGRSSHSRWSPKPMVLDKNGKKVTPESPSPSTQMTEPSSVPSRRRATSPFSRPRRHLAPKEKETRDDVRDGKFFHVRLTFDELEGLKMSKLASSMIKSPPSTPASTPASTPGALDAEDASQASAAPEVVCVYAAIPEENGGVDMRYTVSQPLNLDSPDLPVQWPQPDDTKRRGSSKRRLYQSILLRTPDDTARTKNPFFGEIEASPYAPGVVSIQVGLVKGNEKIPIGIASLAIAGQDVERERISLRMRPVKEKKRTTSVKQIDGGSYVKEARQRGFGAFLAKKKSRPLLKENTESSDKVFRLAPNASISLFVDVTSGMYEGRGPGLWGDLLDDEESFGPVPVVTVPDTGIGELSNRYSHETVEVLNTGIGTTIISSPGSQYGEDGDAGGVDIGSHITPSIFSSQISSYQLAKKPNMSPLMITGIADFAVFCGAMDDVDERGIQNAFSFTTTIPDEELDTDDLDFSQQVSVSLPPTLAAVSDDIETATPVTGGAEPSVDEQSTFDETNTRPSTNAEESVALQSSRTEVLSVGERTLNSVNRAKRTLHKYANKLGVKVEDLLDAGTASDDDEE